jgi:hypothetical protein
MNERSAFPGESCDAMATKLMVGTQKDGRPLRIPVCAHHAERVMAHRTAMDLWPSVSLVDVLDDAVVRTRAALRIHIAKCAQCQPVDDFIRNTMAKKGVQTDPFELGQKILAEACPEGQKLWQDNGAAMLGLEGLI